MAAIISEKFRIFNAKQFLESLSEGTAGTADRTRMYFFVGRSTKWDAHLDIFNQSATAFSVGETVSGGGWSGVVSEVQANSLLLTTILPTATTTPAFGTTITGGTSGATAASGAYRYATEEVPPTPIDNQAEKQDVYEELIAAKRITDTFARLVVPRYNWNTTINPKFDMYRPNYSATPAGGGAIGIQPATGGSSSLPGSKFYVMNSNYQVFKCLYNGQSSANPTGVNVAANGEPTSSPSAGAGTFAGGIYTESTGNYIWKHMYTLTTGDVLSFLSTDFIPIAAVGEASRVSVEGAAVDGAIHIALDNNVGTSGLPASATLYTPVKGDGNGAVVKIETTAGGAVSTISMESVGSGYTYGNVILSTSTVFTDTGLTTNPAAFTAVGGIEVVISPEGGHGSSAEAELFAKRVMTNIRLTYAEGSGDFPVDNDFRRIGIIQDPLDYGTTNVATDPTRRGTFAVKLNGATADYVADETITQTVTGGTAKGTVVSWDTTNGILKYFQSPTTHTDSGVVRAFESNAANAVVGGTSTASGTVDTAQNTALVEVSFTGGLATPEIEPNSGDIVYIENRRQITRAPDQIEDIKLVIEF